MSPDRRMAAIAVAPEYVAGAPTRWRKLYPHLPPILDGSILERRERPCTETPHDASL